MKKPIYVLAIALIMSLSSACAKATPEPVIYTVEMTEYAFIPTTIETRVGQEVTLNLVNKGALEHEIMFGRDIMMVDNHPSGYMQDMFKKAGIEPTVMMMDGMQDMPAESHEHSGYMVVLPKPGDQASIKFTVTKDMVGEWEMGCFELDGVHYTSGMKGKFIVQP